MKLTEMPDSATILASRGRIDFYLWMGIPVGRSWPRYRPYVASAAELGTRNRFRGGVRTAGACSDAVRAAYQSWMAGAVGVTWVDFQRSIAMNGDGWISG